MMQLICNVYFEIVPHRIVLGVFLGSGRCLLFYDIYTQEHGYVIAEFRPFTLSDNIFNDCIDIYR